MAWPQIKTRRSILRHSETSTLLYPGVQAEQADASRVDHVSHRVRAGSVQVLLVLPGLDELPRGQVGLKALTTHKVVLAAISLVYPRASGRVYMTEELQ